MTWQLERTVGGGTPFFDRMDALLSSDYFYDIQLERFTFKYETALPTPRIIVSGKWGYGFKNWVWRYAPFLPIPMLVPGGLRHDDLPVSSRFVIFTPGNYKDQRFVFLDNSCYLGRTRDKIKTRIEEAGGELIDSLILYDGSVSPIEGMKGLFRYHE
jgi:hypothetical protein